MSESIYPDREPSDNAHQDYLDGFTKGIAKGRADALKEAAETVSQQRNTCAWARKGLWCGTDDCRCEHLRVAAERIEALAQQPIQQPPKRECGTCRHNLSMCQLCKDFSHFEPKAGA